MRRAYFSTPSLHQHITCFGCDGRQQLLWGCAGGLRVWVSCAYLMQHARPHQRTRSMCLWVCVCLQATDAGPGSDVLDNHLMACWLYLVAPSAQLPCLGTRRLDCVYPAAQGTGTAHLGVHDLRVVSFLFARSRRSLWSSAESWTLQSPPPVLARLAWLGKRCCAGRRQQQRQQQQPQQLAGCQVPLQQLQQVLQGGRRWP